MECLDIDAKWPGLTIDVLFDIFGVHKAFTFGSLQRTDYAPSEFFDHLHAAEEKVFMGNICSPLISQGDTRLKLSFYPPYLINDDIFDVMALHFAVSSVVNRMNEAMAGGKARVLSVVIPPSICSRYDADSLHRYDASNIMKHVQDGAPSNLCVAFRITPDIADVRRMANVPGIVGVGDCRESQIQSLGIVSDTPYNPQGLSGIVGHNIQSLGIVGRASGIVTVQVTIPRDCRGI